MLTCTMQSLEDCVAIAKEFADGKSRDELVQFIGEMAYGIACIKQDIVNVKLFGKKGLQV